MCVCVHIGIYSNTIEHCILVVLYTVPTIGTLQFSLAMYGYIGIIKGRALSSMNNSICFTTSTHYNARPSTHLREMTLLSFPSSLPSSVAWSSLQTSSLPTTTVLTHHCMLQRSSGRWERWDERDGDRWLENT